MAHNTKNRMAAMTEQEYIMATSLARVRAIKALMRELGPPEIVPNISAGDYYAVGKILHKWEEALAANTVVG